MPSTHFPNFNAAIRNSPRPTKSSLGIRIAFVSGAVLLSGAVVGAVLYEASGGSTPPRGASTSTALPLSPSHFTPVKVTGSAPSDPSGSHKLISLRVPPHLKTIPPSPVYSVYLKDSDIQVERPYTPLKGIEQDGTMTFWVKKYEHGEVGRWFHRRKVGETVEIRGPVKTFDWQEGVWDEVILISGGTGITPFYQLLHNIFSKTPAQSNRPAGVAEHAVGSNPRPTHITLMHASSSTETLPPPLILNDIHEWQDDRPDKFTFKVFISNPDEAQGGRRIGLESMEETRLERGLVVKPSWSDRIRGIKRDPDIKKRVLFVVCGPEGLITDIAGSRIGRPEVASRVGGILGVMGYSPNEVRKL